MHNDPETRRLGGTLVAELKFGLVHSAQLPSLRKDPREPYPTLEASDKPLDPRASGRLGPTRPSAEDSVSLLNKQLITTHITSLLCI